MPISIRQAKVGDMQAIQNANLHNLPENYFLKYYLYHILSWPQASYVAVSTDFDELDDVQESSYTKEMHYENKSNPAYANPREKVVGYILAKMEDDPNAADKTPHAHVTSISVFRTYRRMGIAEKLMRQSLYALCEVYQAKYVNLHVRKSNAAALHLYKTTLQFTVLDIESSYYSDGEDAYSMKKDLVLHELEPWKFQKSEQIDDFTKDLLSDDEGDDEKDKLTEKVAQLELS